MRKILTAFTFAALAFSVVSTAAQAENLRPRYMLDDQGYLIQTYQADGSHQPYCFKHRVAIEDDYGMVTWRWVKECELRKVQIRYRRPDINLTHVKEISDHGDKGSRGDTGGQNNSPR